ncbi:hypothetical protein E7Y31_20650 [Candidatus Frankia alpina]|uniref:Uncharacterized protein n=2 Tax=Candidatus Frankia alpina TaxID=2699483 RepID=A0A4S5C9K0_9ACTN|nr:hypothetical protein E7Y31_20650 [Candidatus Frankia alpina]
MVKILTAKALTAAVVIGGTLFATGGTSFAAGTLPNGAPVTASGSGSSITAAWTAATANAEQQCQSGKVTTGSYSGGTKNGKWWTISYTGNCL